MLKHYFHSRAVRMRSGDVWRPAVGNARLVVHADANHLRSGDLVRVYGRWSALPRRPIRASMIFRCTIGDSGCWRLCTFITWSRSSC